MTESEINWRLKRVYAAFEDKSGFRPEDIKAEIHRSDIGLVFSQDFRGGRSQENLDADAASVINEIMGIRDRAKSWLKSRGDDPKKVDDFIRSELAVALVHDLANTDKHGQLDGPPFSGHKPKVVKVDRAATLAYDAATGTYATSGQFVGPTIDTWTGQIVGAGSSSNLEVVLISDIQDEGGNKVGELQKVLPDAIYKWEQFLVSLGLVLA
jgi:hypothetical protein